MSNSTLPVSQLLGPLMMHCPAAGCGCEWNSRIAGEGCWFCGTQGVPGRNPRPDGRSAPPLSGAANWRAGDDE